MANLTSSLIVRLIDQVSRPARNVSRNLLGMQRATAGARNASFGTRLATSIQRNDRALANARGGMVDAAAGFYALRAAIAAPVQAAMEFESAMADVSKVVDFPTPEAFNEFRDGLIALSKQVPISVNGLASIAAAAGQAGIAGADLISFTETAAKVGVAFDISADQAGESMAKMMTGLGMSIDEVLLLSDAMNHLSNSQASSAAEILDVVRRVGASGTQYGYAATEVAAFASAMIAAGATSETASTSFRNMGLRLNLGASATNRQKAALSRLGLEATDVARRMQEDAAGTTVDVMERLAGLPADVRAAVSSDLFGNEARALGPLLTNLDLLRSSLGLVDDESKFAGSSFREFEVRAGTFQNAVQIFNNRLTAMKVVIGSALIPVINDLMDAIVPVIEGISSFAAAHPELVANVMAAVGSVVALKVAVAGLKFVGLLGRGGALSLLSLGLNTVGRASMRLWGAAAANVAYQGSLSAMAGAGTLSKLGKLSAAIRGMAFAVPGVAALSAVFGWVASAAVAVGAGIAGITAPVWGAIALAVAAVAAAGYSLWKWWDRISSVFSGVARRIMEELQPAFDAIKPVLEAISPVTDAVAASFGLMKDAVGVVIDWFKSAWNDFAGWIGGFFQREVLTESQKADFEQSGYDMADRMIESVKSVVMSLVDWFRELPGRIIDAIGSIDLGSIIKWPEPPDWWKRLTGTDVAPVAVSVAQFGGFSQLTPDQQNAARTVEQAAAGSLPTTGHISGLKSAAEGLREEIAGIQFGIDNLVDGPMKPALVAPMQAEMQMLQGELEGVQAEIVASEAEAASLTAALGVLSDTDATPSISTASIDAALAKVQRLSANLNAINGSSPGVRTSVPIDGARAKGGPVGSGETHLVGEEGPELVTFGRSGLVHSAGATMRMLRGMTGAIAGIGSGSAPAPSVGGVDMGAILRGGAESIASTASSALGAASGGREPMVLKIDGPLTGPITIANGQSPMDAVDQLGDALEAKLSQIMRGLQLDGA
jgi:TP901 family phage tail tape measure protein